MQPIFERCQHTAGHLVYNYKRLPFSPYVILERSLCFLYTDLMATFSRVPLNQLLQQNIRKFLCILCSGRVHFAPKSKGDVLYTSRVGKLGRHFDAIVPLLLTRKCKLFRNSVKDYTLHFMKPCSEKVQNNA